MRLLDGVRVLDLSRVLAGPYCTALLADMGAEVVKVEPPDTGEDARSLGPFRNGRSVYFALNNRGKKSICLDLKNAADLERFQALAARADVVVENFRPGVAKRLGVDHVTLAAVNPRLVYLSISGFGQDGPLSQRPAYDLVVQAMSGLMSVTGWPEGPPTRVGESLGDVTAGLFGAWAVCAALFARSRTGRGEHLDVAMFDSLLALEVTSLSRWFASGETPGRVGNRHPVSTPFDAYRASDGLVVIAVANEALFARLAALIGRPDMTTDPRFADDGARTRHEPEVRRAIEGWTLSRRVEEVVAACGAAGVPSAPIWDVPAALASAHVRERGLVQRLDHPALGPIGLPRAPVRLGTAELTPPGREPELGEHTAAVLRDWLGLENATDPEESKR